MIHFDFTLEDEEAKLLFQVMRGWTAHAVVKSWSAHYSERPWYKEHVLLMENLTKKMKNTKEE